MVGRILLGDVTTGWGARAGADWFQCVGLWVSTGLVSIYITYSGSLVSVLDSRAGGPSSIPDVGGDILKVVVAGFYGAVPGLEECGRSAVREKEATGCMTADRKPWSRAKISF
jgi:hypothetical protein